MGADRSWIESFEGGGRMREYVERREIENIYEKAKKNIKAQIEAKGISMKGSAKGQALSEIMAVIDKEMEIGIAEELVTARRLCRQYYSKYSDVEILERKIAENEKKLKEQQAIVDLTSHLTDEVLRNAILAYNAIKIDRYRSAGSVDAKEIAIAYINSKGREDLKDVLEVEE